MQYLNQHNKMAVDDIEKRLQIAFQLLNVFRPIYPHCLVVPFGSVISGPGTSLSDCDFCLIRHPTPHQAYVMTGMRYFSPQLMPIVERLEKDYGQEIYPAALALERGKSTVSTHSPLPLLEGKVSAATPLRGERKVERIKDTKLVLKEIGRVVQGIATGKVRSIPHARCPIVKFYHKSTGLECDLSVDQW